MIWQSRIIGVLTIARAVRSKDEEMLIGRFGEAQKV
jgi:hypothetical protein